MTFLKGKLTYVAAALAVLWGAYGYISGWIDGKTALDAIWAGLAAFGIRRAIGTLQTQ